MLHGNRMLLHLLRLVCVLCLGLSGLSSLLVCVSCCLRLSLSHGLGMGVAGLLLRVHLLVVVLSRLLHCAEVRREVWHIGEAWCSHASLHRGNVLRVHVGRHVIRETHAHAVLMLLLLLLEHLGLLLA